MLVCFNLKEPINILRAGHARLACEVNGAVMPSAAGTHRSYSGMAQRHA